MNKVTLVGRLGAEIKYRETKSKKPVASFSVATNDGYKNKDGEWVDATEWHQIVTYQEGLINMLKKHGQKGRLVAIDGSLKTQSYRNEGEDSDRRSTEILVGIRGQIEFLEPLKSNA